MRLTGIQSLPDVHQQIECRLRNNMTQFLPENYQKAIRRTETTKHITNGMITVFNSVLYLSKYWKNLPIDTFSDFLTGTLRILKNH